jgi:hypothetical protein
MSRLRKHTVDKTSSDLFAAIREKLCGPEALRRDAIEMIKQNERHWAYLQSGKPKSFAEFSRARFDGDI